MMYLQAKHDMEILLLNKKIQKLTNGPRVASSTQQSNSIRQARMYPVITKDLRFGGTNQIRLLQLLFVFSFYLRVLWLLSWSLLQVV